MQIIKIQPRGVITIPSDLRDPDFGANSFVQIKKEKRRLIIEPIQVLAYPVRSYTDQELDEFLELDAIETKDLKKKNILK